MWEGAGEGTNSSRGTACCTAPIEGAGEPASLQQGNRGADPGHVTAMPRTRLIGRPGCLRPLPGQSLSYSHRLLLYKRL